MINYESLISNDAAEDALKGYNDLAGLFYTLRIVNYFRYGIVFPSFGVDLPDEI